MKKTIIASMVSLAAISMFASYATAATGDVQFIGAVTATTCALTPEIAGSSNPIIQLKDVATSGAGTAVTFTLKAGSAAGCQSLDNTKTAEISWMGQFNSEGLMNQGGSATGAWVKLTAVNSQTANTDITAASPSATFGGDVIKTNGAQFSATLKGGSVAGDFRSVAAFAVAYK
ncbi:hypothetical protein A9798_12320 [Edwardsiella hoshinae]|uniref:Fimbrial protein PefA n=1 Tax=Edwardsiella hoshinae TaxID=93378 RepID=A0ABN4T177_9GAMM|nr:hypothetical protein [Edwardsiella hoshinae]AOV97656.1 hypothetical protein A9798_12320 [Edwardsiella hoshinae]